MATRRRFLQYAAFSIGAFAIGPLEAQLAAGPRVVDANRHCPTFGTEHPFLDELGVSVGAVDRFRGRGEPPGYNDMGIAFGFHRQFAHRISSPFFGLIRGSFTSFVLDSRLISDNI